MTDSLNTMPRMSQTHPECAKDEILWGNEEPSQFSGIAWKTKRVGRQPYYLTGRPINEGSSKRLRPVFIQIAEAEAEGYTKGEDGVWRK